MPHMGENPGMGCWSPEEWDVGVLEYWARRRTPSLHHSHSPASIGCRLPCMRRAGYRKAVASLKKGLTYDAGQTNVAQHRQRALGCDGGRAGQAALSAHPRAVETGRAPGRK